MRKAGPSPNAVPCTTATPSASSNSVTKSSSLESFFPVEAVFFDHGQLAEQFQVGDVLDAAFRLKRTRFDGYWRLEMELLDVAAM